MKRKMTNKKKLMAYVLNKDPDFDISAKKISKLFDVSQSTISNSIKEVSYEKRIYDLETELSKAKKAVLDIYDTKLISPITFE